MNRRSVLKWMHWLSAGLIGYFFLVEPDELPADPGAGLSTHAGMGLLLAIVVGIWTLIYLRKGLAGRPGPKLPRPLKPLHPLSHKALQLGMPIVVATGAMAGLVAPFAIHAFGWLQINPGIGSKTIHDLAQEIHEIAFDALVLVVIAHIVFHLWRHLWLKDNALRIMVPRILHKYL
ncbi:cytochrome b [Tropicibacter sp. Alg240-R139]|uniref:cytochrome b n=1 Tax=Tropicibacter sp. Alg240-R139 TaxID=2305991 RepID=UPI0013DF5D85|nr:cytochrome b/b6 domain-containing protein [Tropicibacter sp. Alg240-R139]